MSAGEQQARATFWLLDAPDGLRAQSHREPDGTGLGWFGPDGAPQVRKQPLAAYADSEFAREAHAVSSRTFLAHIRFASTGALELRNTHPFEQEGRLFAHNGVIENLPRLDAHLGAARELVAGDTDSERLFALITREIAVHDGDIAAGIESACRWVAENLPLLAINLILATAEGLWALRYPETHELHLLERTPGDTLEHASSLGSRVHSEDGVHRPLVVLASEPMDDDPRWRPLASGELVHVGPRLRVDSRRILEQAPAHPLTLADLDARARASQSAAAQHPGG
jgi:predicted glutamine amidotransferase